MTAFDPSYPVVSLEGPLDSIHVAALVRERIPDVLPTLLPGRRWFGEKDRRVRGVTAESIAVVEADADWVALSVVRVDLDGGDVGRYLVPLSLVAEPPLDPWLLVPVETSAGRRFLIDAFATAAFARWFVGRLGSRQPLMAEGGEFRWEPLPGLHARLASALAATPALGTAEQSNTSVRYGDSLFLKVFRRLRAGPNPDEEVGRYLATRTAFRSLPLPLATARYVDEKGVAYPLALAQSFATSVGDGWSFALHLLATSPSELTPSFEGLGARTAQLHLALGQETDDPAFAPEVITADDARRWEDALRDRLDAVAVELRRQAPALDPSLVDPVDRLLAQLPELRHRAGGFRWEVGRPKIRVHGDYHLGQVLRTPDDDWTILDFEGEPARTIEERRAKTSPLKDVAGMLRSFGYARSAALRGSADDAMRRTGLGEWEAGARATFLRGYRTTIDGSGSEPLPAAAEGFRAALAAWELDKAVYELRYELSNRPDWVGHALDTLVGQSSPGRGVA